MTPFAFWLFVLVGIGCAYIAVRTVSSQCRKSRCHGKRMHYDLFDDVERCDQCNMAND